MVRQGLRILAFVVLSAATAVALAPNSGSTATGGDPPTWTVIDPPRMPLGDPFQAMSRPDPAHCWATDIQGGTQLDFRGGANRISSTDWATGTTSGHPAPNGGELRGRGAERHPGVSPTSSGAIWTTSSSSPSLWGTTSLSCREERHGRYAGGAQRRRGRLHGAVETWTLGGADVVGRERDQLSGRVGVLRRERLRLHLHHRRRGHLERPRTPIVVGPDFAAHLSDHHHVHRIEHLRRVHIPDHGRGRLGNRRQRPLPTSGTPPCRET